MPSPSHQAYRTSVLSWFRNHGHEPDVARTLETLAEPMLVLWHLDLEPARPILRRGYAPNPRGGDPWDPLVLLRCLLLAALLGRARINAWVRDLTHSRVLCVLCGVDPGPGRPGVGTLYDFLHRLHNGPVRDCPCGLRKSPATLERQRAAAPRPRNNKPPRRTPQTKADKRARRRTRAKDPITATAQAPHSATRDLVEKLRAEAQRLNPEDLLQRLAQMLLELAIVRSAQQGLLGNPDALVLCGDGSPLKTGASPKGRRACTCPKGARCACGRVSSDPDAAWGYDAYRDRYVFGHHVYEYTVAVAGHDLPLHLRLDPANESDHTASLKSLDHLLKLLRHSRPELRVRTLVQDKGHDGELNYRFPLDHGITPVIPLAKDAPAFHPQRPALPLSSRGVPLCQAGLEMAPWGSAGSHRRLFVCPVKAGLHNRCPLAPDADPAWRCRPGASRAPVVNLSVSQNPRLCPPVPRNSARHAELYALRSGCERSFSVKKERFRLEDARHRRWSFWIIRLYLIAVLQHARAWVVDQDPMALVDHLLGRTPQQAAA
jgi:hypothetical protein